MNQAYARTQGSKDVLPAGDRQAGRSGGLYCLVFYSLALSILTWWYSSHYSRELSGIAVSWLIVTGCAFVYVVIYYIYGKHIQPIALGVADAAIWGIASGFVGLIAVTIYRSQTGGLTVNDLEACLAFGSWFLFCAFVQSTKNRFQAK